MKPHRGTLILVLGILSLLCGCLGLALGPAALIMGNADQKEMAAGTMDPSGAGLTKAGKICGIIGTVLGAVSLVFIGLGIIGGALGKH